MRGSRPADLARGRRSKIGNHSLEVSSLLRPPRSANRGLAALGGLAIAWLIGQIVREQFWITGICFFIPSPLVAAVMLAAACFYRSKQFARHSQWALALAVAPLLVVLTVENQWTAPEAAPAGPKTLRLVHWNIWHGTLGSSRVRAVLADYKADIYVFSEAPEKVDFGNLDERIKAEYSTVRISDMTVVARGKLTIDTIFRFGGGHGGLVRWTNNNETISLLVADLPSRITAGRGPLLMQLQGLIKQYQPDLVVGDLNSPRRCQWLANLPRGYSHAYETAGKGWSYTWPVICPLWAIDQCITGPRIRAVRYGLHSTTASDHRLQCLDFEIEEQPVE